MTIAEDPMYIKLKEWLNRTKPKIFTTRHVDGTPDPDIYMSVTDFLDYLHELDDEDRKANQEPSPLPTILEIDPETARKAK